MAITVTSLQTIVSTGASATQTSTLATTLTITPNPLTTAFEPPSYCTQSYLSNCQTDAVSGTLPCFVSVYPEGVCDSNGQSCYPPVPGVLDNTYLYSPGLSCPSGWSTAWKEVRTPTGEDEETTAHCCPTGLTVTTYGIYSTWCEGTVTAGEETMIVNGLSQCPSSTTAFTFGPDKAIQLTWVDRESTTLSVSGDAVFTVSAERVALLYRSSDMTAAGAAATGGSGSSSSNSGSSSSGSSNSGSGLSTGAVAGIAIGAAAVGIFAVLAFFWFFLRRRNGAHRHAPKNVPGDAQPGPGAAHSAPHAPTGAEHELKATDSVSTRPIPASHANPNAMELHGSTPIAQPWSGASPQGAGGNVYSPHGGEMPGIGEVSTSNDYHQLSGTFEGARGVMDNSRQNTPVDLVGRGAGGTGFPPEKGSGW
ncbi:hypothetical protein J7T55_010625 [Diaporthe amygdali]|uniref:uncharacterized protein n=1 Tax=Phomopsis amygdali TaxID=1214568 RepID=UPI0022FE00F3|nr:uncharacterized protein J7T55_010625 [Diaporthe amygdali]KAJ0114238.1 hypothetical protein J7T55_010625 [Diaporthe amygdali]